MMITLYTTHCPRCKVLETKLKNKGLDYSVVDDVNEITNLGILTVPVLNVDDVFYQFKEANDWINKQEARTNED